ncbi:MAG: glycogen/starch synthase, partial [Bacteroidales bacterium]|nr:glycogen/starch synthase [Bacteroidales bacterium]
YLPEGPVSTIGRQLPQGIQELKKETRSFMPRFGCINERKNQLHEVIRLSGMNIIIGDVDRPLIIKVASIPSARIQVYFIDNEDYFRRKQIYTDNSGNFFQDNDERAIFFARGVMETVKKLRWAPDIIHCQGWISHLVPAFLKKAYKDDPIFSSCKLVVSLFNDLGDEKFNPAFRSKACFGGLGAQDLPFLENPDGINLAKTAIQYADGVIFGTAKPAAELVSYCKDLKLPVLPFNREALEDGSYVGEYNAFYDKL